MYSKRRVLLGVIATAILINLIQFRLIDLQLNANYSALNRSPTSDIVAIGSSESTYINQRYGFYFALAEIARSSRIILPDTGPLSTEEFQARFLSYGQAKSIKRVPYDYEANSFLPDNLSPDFFITEATDDSLPYSIAALDLTYDRKEGYPWSIVTIPSLKARAQAGQKEFILLRWDRSEADRHLILLETSLLPDSITKDLVQ